jgi:hypothetical protein
VTRTEGMTDGGQYPTFASPAANAAAPEAPSVAAAEAAEPEGTQ